MSRPRRPRSHPAGGFTLLETMVALIVFGLIGAAIYGVMIRTNQSGRLGASLAEAQQNARAALDLILRDLRQAGYGIDPESFVPVETASEYRVTFTIDRDADGAIEAGERITYFLDNDPDDPIVATTPNPDDYVLRRIVSTDTDSLAVPENRKGEVVAYGVTQRTPDHSGWDVRLFDYFGAEGTSMIGAGSDPDGTQFGLTVPDSVLGKPAGGDYDTELRSVRIEVVAEASHRHPETHTYPQVRVSGTIHPRNLGLHTFAALGVHLPDNPTGTGTGTGEPTGTGTGTGTGTATGTGIPELPTYEPPLRIPTGRVLSLLAADLHERDSAEGSQVTTDHQHDYDLVLGTVKGLDNLAVWFEGYPDRYDGNRLYQALPNYRGRSPRDIYALVAGGLDESLPDYVDLAAAVEVSDYSGGFEVWFNQALLGEGRVGMGAAGSTAPNAYYSESSGSGRAIALGDMDLNGTLDVVLGTRTGTNNGAVEIWYNGDLTSLFTLDRRLTASGEVNSLVVADFNGDSWPDIAAGTKTSTNDQSGKVEVWLNNRDHNYQRRGPWSSDGKVNSLAAGRMDADSDIDLVAGIKSGNNRGTVELWLNDGGGNMIVGDRATADDVVHSVAVGLLDYGNDALDIAAGTAARSVQAWYCNPDASTPSGIIPANESWADANAGGVVNAVSIRRLEAPRDNPEVDLLGDIVAGTAIDASQGEIVLYMNPYVWNLNP